MTNPTPDPDLAAVERTSVLALDPAAPPGEAGRVGEALARLTGVGSATLAPLVRVVPLPEGMALTHRLASDAVSLADLRRTGPLRAGHVVTVGLAVADALVDLAEAGLAHGGVTAEQVLAAPDGSILLAGCGLAWRHPPGDIDGPRVADDVAAVGELVRDLLGAGSSPSALVLAALRAADPDPGLRPSPADLHALLRRCGRSDPLLELLWSGSGPAVHPEARPAPRLRIDPRTAPATPVPVAGPPEDLRSGRSASAPGRSPREQRGAAPRRPTSRSRRRSRRGGPLLVVALSVVALLLLAAVRVGGRALAEAPAATPAPSVSASPPVDGSGLLLDRGSVVADPDWPAALAAADAGRSRALASGDPAALREWVDPGGSAWASDAALVARVAAARARIVGGALVVVQVRPEEVSDDRAVLLVQDRRVAYSVLTESGTTAVPARAARWWRVTLSADPSAPGAVRWRLHDVEPAPEPSGTPTTGAG